MITNKNDKKDYEDRRKIIATTIASPLSSLVAKFVTYPIDTIKTKIQANRSGLHHLSDYNFGHSIKLSITLLIKQNRFISRKELEVIFLVQQLLLSVL